MADFKVCLLCWYVCNQKTNGELGYSKTISKFYVDRFLLFFLIRHHVTFKVRVLRGVDWQSHIGLIFIITVMWTLLYEINLLVVSLICHYYWL